MCLVAAIGTFAYSNSFDGVFVLDDEPAIVENPRIRSLSPIASALGAPAGTTISGRPTIAFTLALNYALSPVEGRGDFTDARQRRGFHYFNLIVHLASALLLFGVVRRTLRTDPLRDRFGASADSLALSVALMWVVHPLTTSAVTYVIQRAESVMALMFLTTLYCSIRAWEQRLPWTALAIMSCALGVGAKESMVTAPIAVALWDYMFVPSSVRRWKLYAGLAGTWLLLAYLVAGGHRPDAAGFGFADWPWWRYLITQAGVLLHYLALVFVPSPLVLDYGWPPAVVGVTVFAQVASVAALEIFVLWMLWRRNVVAYAPAVALLVLAPTSSIFPIVTEVAAEHRMYLPLACIIATLVPVGFVWLHRLAVPSFTGPLAVAVIVISLTTVTMARNRDYQSHEGIWRDTVSKRPLNPRARHNYATLLLAEHRYVEAEAHLRAALGIRADFPEALTALGVALSAQGRFDEGIPQLERALSLAPGNATAEQSLGEAYGAVGNIRLALQHFDLALRRRPDDVMLLNRVGWILATDGDATLRDGTRALQLAERALALTSRGDVVSLDTAAAALAEVNRFDEAVATAREALVLARSRQETAIIPELQQRLDLYQARRPFRQPVVRR